MRPESHSIEVVKTARYVSMGPPITEAKDLLIALHGYGQLPSFFIQKFEFLATAGWTIIAPEGPHRFYLNGTSGRVGASWMTKEDRENDIANYVSYLDAVMTNLNEIGAPADPVLLGFSQGVATASRWAALGQHSFSKIILWAGVFPPDYPWENGCDALQNNKIQIVQGTQDPFLKDMDTDQTRRILQTNGVDFTMYSFEGGHDIHADSLKSILDH